MKLVLKEFQEAAVTRIVRQLRLAANESQEGDRQAVCLSSTTGSGKTVMLTRVVELLLSGDDEHAAVSDATFLWITDQPELNRQTRQKMLGTSSVLTPDKLVVVDAAYDQEVMNGGSVHFINVQKLGKDKGLVTTGDKRTFTLWETLRNTIEARPGKFFVIIDEAHRGMREDEAGDREAATIIQKFIKGSPDETPPVPVVLGVSATPDRFTGLIAGTGRAYRPVDVDVADVRESGLIKDLIVIHHPKREQPTDMTMLREAARTLKSFTAHWSKYCAAEEEFVVAPLLVVQLEDARTKGQVSETDVGQAMLVLGEELGSLPADAYAHALQEGTTLRFGPVEVRYLAPSDIEADPDVRVVFFKTSLNTGWDCPRAEVMMSFRAAADSTYIAQLVGRMVRTPLARRIVTDETLNTVALYLPHYDSKSLAKIIEKLSKPESGAAPVEIDDADELIELKRAPGTERVFDILSSLPSYIVPRKRKSSQIRRLMKFARLLTNGEVDETAFASAQDHLLAAIDAEYERRKAEPRFKKIVNERGEIEIDSVNWEVGTDILHQAGTKRVNIAAENLEDLFEATGRKLTEGLHKEWWRRRVRSKSSDKETAKLELFALCIEPDVIHAIERAAQGLVAKWLQQHSLAIGKLDEGARTAYSEIRSLAAVPELAPLNYPATIFARRAGERIARHAYVSEDNDVPVKLNKPETRILNDALADDSIVAWLRNVDRKPWALCVPYQVDGEIRAFFPDFLLIRAVGHDLVVDLMEPHEVTWADAPAKAVGLAKFAAKHQDRFGRILLVLLDKAIVKVFDLANEMARDKLIAVTTIEHLRSLMKD